MSTGTGHCPSPTPTATISSRAIRRKHHPRATTTASSLPAAAAAISLLLALRSIPAAAAAANSRRAIGASPSSPPTAFLTAGRAHHFRRSARRPPIMNGGSASAALAVAGACAATRTARAFSATNMSATTTPRSRGRGVAMAAAAATTAGDGEAAGGGGGVAATAMDETLQTKPGRTGTGGSPSRSRPPLSSLAEHWDYSWIDQLTPETDPKHPSENKKMRPVFGGHYVLVEPTPLKNPRLVAYSPDVALDLLGLTESDVESEEFARFFSGDVGVLAGGNGDDDDGGDGKEVEEVMTWATPYALSIMGTRYTSNCPYGTGDGYGDGRAISVGEVLLPPSGTCDEGEDATMTEGEAGAGDGGGAAARPRRLEMQLKGAGRTPFCRGADGRAVLRSSIREFLASEAMHYLGVSTTRALSLVVSDGPGGDVSRRQWYSDQQQQMDGFNPGQPRRPPGLPTVDDPRLAAYPLEKRKQIIASLAKQKRDPDVMIEEPNAIACRVAPSFVRVGHVDLFARRVSTKSLDEETGKYDKTSQEWRELAEMLWHAAYREFREEAYEPYFADDDLHGCVTTMLRLSADKIAVMVADWIRVGFCQGNFNADNCLVGGRTMDYGPFGFMDGYDPLFAKWTGSGEHFGFLNQPTAGYVNYAVLVESAFQALRTVPPVEEGGDADADADVRREEEEILEYAQGVFQRRVKGVFRRKLGFDPDDDATSSDAGLLWQRLEPMLREGKADWTVFWRQLTNVAAAYPIAEGSTDHAAMVDMLCGRGVEDPTSPFYEAVSERTREKLLEWMKEWRESLSSSAAAAQNSDSASAAPVTQPEERMRLANPKYILREWMLVDAYTKAAGGDENMIHELLDLIRHPYDEGRDDQHKRYYRRAPDESLTAGGTAYMT